MTHTSLQLRVCEVGEVAMGVPRPVKLIGRAGSSQVNFGQV